MTTTSLHREHSTSSNNSAKMNQDTICVQQHNCPSYGDQALTERMKRRMTVALSSIEMRTQDEYKTLDNVVRSVALSSQAMNSFAVNGPPQNFNTCKSIVRPFKMKRDAVKNLQKETYTVVFPSANAKDDIAPMDQSQTSYTYKNVSDRTEGFGTSGHEINNGQAITSHYSRQHYEGSEICISNTKDGEYCKSNSLTNPDSNIQQLRDLGSDHHNKVNDATISNSNPSDSRHLPGSSSTPTKAVNNTKAKTLSGHTFEIEHKKRVVFTELNLKGARQKNVRISPDRWSPSITGCVFMSDDRVVLCDQHDYSNGTLILLDQSFSLQDRLDLTSRTNDVSVVDDTTVIITLPIKRQLQYVEVAASLRLGRVIQLDRVCWCVHVVGNNIYVICRYPGGYGEVRTRMET